MKYFLILFDFMKIIQGSDLCFNPFYGSGRNVLRVKFNIGTGFIQI